MNRIIDRLLLAEPFRPFWIDMSNGSFYQVEKASDLEIVNDEVLLFARNRYLNRCQIVGLDLGNRKSATQEYLDSLTDRE